MQNNDLDYDFALRLQQLELLNNEPLYRNYHEDETDESFEETLSGRTSHDTTPIVNNRQDERRDSSVENDYAIAMQLQQILNEEALEENMIGKNIFEFENYETNSETEIGHFRRNNAIETNRAYIENLEDEDEDDLDQDLKTIIAQFKNKLIQKHPAAPRRIIRLSSRNQLLMFSEFIEAIKLFRDIDFIQRPMIEFKHEPVVDGGGAFNDTIRQILDTFMSLENPEYGGNGRLFTGDDSKLISSTAPISVLDELNIFGDILFLAIVNDAPFPVDLDIILFKYCLDLENTITLKDVERFNPVMYNLAREVLNASPDVDLSTIDGFDQWAEDKEISKIQRQVYSRSKENLRKLAKEICHDILIHSRIKQLNAIKLKLNKFGFLNVLKEKQIKIDQVKDYFYRESITYDDIIRKLVFSPANLSRRQNAVKNWLIEWLQAQRKEELQEFCKLVTGFIHPREEITVAFKTYIARENREAALTPRFSTCFSEMKISEFFNSKHELFAIMNAQVNKDLHDDRFTVA
ncbi:23693_t:CDS:10 [Dentiscutata erythropus]|uniref:23693_t:CDS:1 n=1 Tax=Dentiscutata erythropus TaxID=1348616 RepID=A0A9N8VZ39_9GLOM|nr:23693_t:CDS:10 [Dentiscutata erythropus]